MQARFVSRVVLSARIFRLGPPRLVGVWRGLQLSYNLTDPARSLSLDLKLRLRRLRWSRWVIWVAAALGWQPADALTLRSCSLAEHLTVCASSSHTPADDIRQCKRTLFAAPM